MRLVRFVLNGEIRVGALRASDAELVDLSPVATSIDQLLAGGSAGLAQARDLANSGKSIPGHEVSLRAPLEPASLRDFLSFEDHAKAGAARRGEDLNPAWYQTPVYYKGNHRQIAGPDETVRWPAWTAKLDFELELACVLGARGRDLDENRAADAIFGYTIMNDWSARDVQRAEMAMRLGPAKSKDFATSLGPCIVTADEFDPTGGISMRARVNGEVWFETAGARMHWSFAAMIAHVSQGEDVFPGDVYGSGTAYGGCGLDQDRWLAHGDVVELEIDGIGALRNAVS